MDNIRINISLIMNQWRKTQSWCVSEQPLTDDIVRALCDGHCDFLDMVLSERPLFVSFVDDVVGNTGRITERSVLIQPYDLQLPVDTFLMNTPFVNILQGENFMEQLGSLSPLFDPDMASVAHEMFSGWAVEHGMHCLAVLK